MSETFYSFDLSVNSDERGNLIAFEKMQNCPFDIKRVFYIYSVPNTDIVRGNHVNLSSNMVISAISGSCAIECNEGNNKKIFTLNSPKTAVFIAKGVERKLYSFSKNAILLCLCDSYFDKNEYSKEG